MAITKLNPLFKSYTAWIVASTEALIGNIYIYEEKMTAVMSALDTCVLLRPTKSILENLSAEIGCAVVCPFIPEGCDELIDWVVSDERELLDLQEESRKNRSYKASCLSYLFSGSPDLERFPTPRPALFLDRDGVVVEDVPYLHQSKDLKVKDGIIDLILKYRKAGYLVFIVSNQSGLGRGMFDISDYQKVTAYLYLELYTSSPDGILISPFYEDSELEEYLCAPQFRKPRTGMIQWLKQMWNLDLDRSLFIGDMASDVLLSQYADIARAFLVKGPRFSGEAQKLKNHSSPPPYEVLENFQSL